MPGQINLPVNIGLPDVSIAANAIDAAAAGNWASATWQTAGAAAAAATNAGISASAAASAATGAQAQAAVATQIIQDLSVLVGHLTDQGAGTLCAKINNILDVVRIGTNIISLFGWDVGRYSLDAAGVAAFEADQASGVVHGDGLVVRFDHYDGINHNMLPVLNPKMLVFLGPDGTTYFNILDVLRALSGDTHYHPSF